MAETGRRSWCKTWCRLYSTLRNKFWSASKQMSLFEIFLHNLTTVTHYQYRIHYWAIWNPLLCFSSHSSLFPFLCLCMTVCVSPFIALRYRFTEYHSACAIGGQHDGHLPFWLPGFMKCIYLLFIEWIILLADGEINRLLLIVTI